MYRIAVCDDLMSERDSLSLVLQEYFTEKKQEYHLQQFSAGEDILVYYEERERPFQLIFMDIIMTGMNGIDTIRRLRTYDRDVSIIFLTTTRDYAVESYEVNATGYLLKPLVKEQIFHYLDYFLLEWESPKLALHVGGSYRYIRYGDICYIESNDHILLLGLRDGEIIKYHEKLDAIEKDLSDKRFLRCHKSYLVNMDYIDRVEEMFILKNEKKIPFRIREKKKMSDYYYQYFLKKNMR